MGDGSQAGRSKGFRGLGGQNKDLSHLESGIPTGFADLKEKTQSDEDEISALLMGLRDVTLDLRHYVPPTPETYFVL